MNTPLDQLTDKELTEYYKLYKLGTTSSTRFESAKINNGIDLKYACHLVRLMLEVEQILTEGDLDLRRHSAQLRNIRQGEWTQERIVSFFVEKEKSLENLYHNSSLQYSVDTDKIKNLLLNCLEHHYGTLKDCVTVLDPASKAINEIKEILGRYNL